MTYELWDLVSRNMIDWFSEQGEAVFAVEAYVDAQEQDEVALLVHDDNEVSHTFTGAHLVEWLHNARAELQRAS